MRVYFDASLLVSLFVADALATRAEIFVKQFSPTPVVSDFASAEFASAVSRLARVGSLNAPETTAVFSEFDMWRANTSASCRVESEDIVACEGFLRRIEPPLATADALHIAVARRLDLPLATFDRQMARAALALGVNLAVPVKVAR